MGRRKVGNVRQTPSGRWEASVSVGAKVDGTPRRTYETFDTEDEARSWALAKSIEMGNRPDLGRGITLAQWWGAYEQGKGSRVARGTMRSYRTYMSTVWLPELGDVDISRIDASMIQEVLLRQGRAKAQHCKSTLSAVLSAAVNYGDVLASNPMLGTRFELPYDTGPDYEDEDAWDDDPFAVLEGKGDHWDATEVARAIPLMVGLRLEPAWLAMVGSGVRMQEAFAIRRMDVRRAQIGTRDEDGRTVPIIATQLAIHHAQSIDDGRKRPKTRRSVRIATMMEPFGTRFWELCQDRGDREEICDVPRSRACHMWSGYFKATNPETIKFRPPGNYGDKGRLAGLRFVKLYKMRKSHETMVQQAQVLDSINASMHGHSQRVAYSNYMAADEAEAVIKTNLWFEKNGLRLVS